MSPLRFRANYALVLISALLAGAPASAQVVILHDFVGGATDGKNPTAALTLSGNILYGMCPSGANNPGILFQIGTNGSGYGLLHTFTGGLTDGANPTGSLRPDRERAFTDAATQARPAETTHFGDSGQVAFLDNCGPMVGKAYAEGRLNFAISIKDPYAWVVSVRRIEHWPAPDDESSIVAACRRFNRKYRDWLPLRAFHSGRVLVVRYEDLLRDLSKTMNTVTAALGVANRTVDWCLPADALVPAHWDDIPSRTTAGIAFDRTYYTDRLYLNDLTPRARDAIQSEIDWNQLADIGYRPI